MGLGIDVKQRKRYPGLVPFTVEQQDIFHGRYEDIERLYNSILIEKLTVLFGKSGYGKSSLLNAGIIPKLNEESNKGKRKYLPILIRLNIYEGNTWIDKFINQIQNANLYLGKEKRGLLMPFHDRDFLPKTLWGELKRRQTDTNYTFVLIFDQFEEFFGYPIKDQKEFKSQLADLLYSDIPDFLEKETDMIPSQFKDIGFLYRNIDVRVLFSLRADRISFLDFFKDKVPTILHKRYELKGLNKEQAEKAIINPANAAGKFSVGKFSYTSRSIEIILNELSNSANKESNDIVESFHLQMICQSIESIVEKHRIKEVRPEDLPDMANIYNTYYNDQINKLPPELQSIAKQIIEEELIDEKDFRRISIDGISLLRKENASQALLNSLEDLFLIRREPNSVGSFGYEISHDVLIHAIMESREKRLLFEKEQKLKEAKDKAKEQEKKLKEERELREQLQLALNEAKVAKQIAEQERKKAEQQTELANLAKIEAERQKKLADNDREDAERQAVLANKAKFDAERERIKAEEQSLKANEAKSEAEKQKKYAKKNAKWGFAIAGIAIILGSVALWFYFDAKQQKEKAIKAEKIAVNNLLQVINEYLLNADTFQASRDINEAKMALDSARSITERYLKEINKNKYDSLIREIKKKEAKIALYSRLRS